MWIFFFSVVLYLFQNREHASTTTANVVFIWFIRNQYDEHFAHCLVMNKKENVVFFFVSALLRSLASQRGWLTLLAIWCSLLMFTVNAKPFISFKKWSFFFTKERNIHLQIRNTHSVRKQARTPFATRRSSCLHFMCIRSPSFFIIRFYRLPFMYTHLHTKHVRMLALYVCICACVCARAILWIVL